MSFTLEFRMSEEPEASSAGSEQIGAFRRWARLTVPMERASRDLVNDPAKAQAAFGTMPDRESEHL